MFRLLGDEGAEGADGVVLQAVCPLFLSEKKACAASRRSFRVILHELLEGGKIIGLAESGPGGMLVAFLKSSVDDEGSGGDHHHNGQNHKILLVAIEELIECGRLLGDLSERTGRFVGICGHWESWISRCGGGVIKAGAASKATRKSGGADFSWYCGGGTLWMRAMSGRVYVVAGELSGDAHGAGLLRSLLVRKPGTMVAGVGGPQMAEVAGTKDWVEDAAVMGVWEVLKRYGWFKERFGEMLEEVRRFRPDVLLLIDYPGFNLRFAKAVKKEFPEVKQVYYISPQVWAWNKKRIPKMVALLDQMMCLFPFEEPIFSGAGLKTKFVGHPLVDELEERRLEIAREESLVGLFPGSREREVSSLFPMMVESAKRLHDWRNGLRFEAPAASAKLAEIMRGMVEEAGAGEFITVTDGGAHALMQQAGCGVIASGTATLEAAYYGLPYCLVYKVAGLTYVMAKLLVKIKFIGIVNILAEEQVVEEFIQGAAEPGKVVPALKRFIEDPATREALQVRLAETSAKLGGLGAHARAAEVVAGWLP
jgi:lipid-A-disaccharide synthase